MSKKKPTVWIVNNSGHDYSPAREFGNLRFLSKGPMNKFDVNHMYRLFDKKMQASKPGDFLLNTGLPQMQQVASSVLVHKHGRLNLLLCKFRKGKPYYVSRQIVLGKKPEKVA